MPDGFLGIFRHEGLELCLGILMFEVRLSRSPKYAGELGPSIRRAHVDDPHRLDSRTRRFDAEEARGLAAFHAAPELLFRRQKQVLIERIGWYLDLDPLAAAGDNRQHRGGGIGDPHVVLELGHVLLRRRLFRERPRQHEFGLEYRASAFDNAVQRRRHPADHRMADPALDVLDDLPGRALVPVPVEVLGREPELDDQIARKVFAARPRLASLARAAAERPRRSPMMIRASEPPMNWRRKLGVFPENALIFASELARRRIASDGMIYTIRND